jgi:Mrp family chromosome partitioning ATPase
MKNHSIRAPEDVEEVLHLPGLGIIPPVQEAIAAEEALTLGQAAGKDKEPVRPGQSGVVGDSPIWPSAGAEAFRLLYSRVTYGWGDHQRTILVTSVAPQEGKTLVAANLAVTFAREGARVLLVDCDLRRPRLHKMFQVTRAPGLVEMLRPEWCAAEEEREAMEHERRPHEHAYSLVPELVRSEEPTTTEPSGEAGTATTIKANGHRPAGPPRSGPPRTAGFRNIRETRSRNLWLLPSGAVKRKDGESLKANTVRALLAEVSSEFDVIILDAPPALVSADAVLLAPVADDVLLVVRAGQTDRNAAARAHQQLIDAGGNVIGAVLNDPKGKLTRDRMLYYKYGGYPVSTD